MKAVVFSLDIFDNYALCKKLSGFICLVKLEAESN
jgi:hypothetical protein